MGNTEHSPTIAEVADSFLASLPPEERGKTQAEVSKFVRWLGSSRHVRDVSPLDVASYGDYTTPSAVKPLRLFLTYIRKKGFSSMRLATHLRAKKPSSKAAAVLQSSEAHVTLTAEGYEKLESELADLKNQRSQITDEMKKAAADKDFRENAPLAAARERKSYLEGRIKEIEAILSRARMVKKDQETSRVRFGDTVLLSDLSSGKEFSYRLVDPREADPAKGKLSVASPLGKAILDKETGQTVEVVAPASTLRYRIAGILGP